MFGLLISRGSSARAACQALRHAGRAFESTLAAGPAAPETVVYPYYVSRTRFQSLPVYTDIRNGRTRMLTLVRRITGDLGALRADLAKELGDESIAIKSAAQQLVIKGDRTKEIREWLTKRGF
ncbi:mitochondrial large ribosomal subunit [Coemansia biformis]|uniref:Large ribosomal subunit protein mL49 n=1 Tax=Coemansia biformis TaxID=1286918 RepID=A0A9W7YEU1_9FUNG|nr:mitochondrial large ribosomal subunit [Coemansia biformis]